MKCISYFKKIQDKMSILGHNNEKNKEIGLQCPLNLWINDIETNNNKWYNNTVESE